MMIIISDMKVWSHRSDYQGFPNNMLDVYSKITNMKFKKKLLKKKKKYIYLFSHCFLLNPGVLQEVTTPPIL